MKQKKETSVVGGIAGFSRPIPVKRKKNMKKKNKKKKIEEQQLKERIYNLTRDKIFKIVVEQGETGDKVKYVMSMFDGIAKKMGLSLTYSKNFMSDAFKVQDVEGALKFNLRRAKTELRHVKKQVEDMERLVDMVYQVSKERSVER